jgi:hypothetical protein
VSAHLIDKDGHYWDQGSGGLQKRFGAHCSAATFENFIVRNLGYVTLQLTESSCAIKVAPSHLSLKAFTTLAQVLGELAVDRYAVSLFQDEWHHLIFRDYSTVLSHLIQSANGSSRGHGDQFAARPRDLSTLPSAHPLMDLLDAWRTSTGSFDVAQHSRLLNDRLSGRFVVIEQNTGGSDLVFSHIGQGFAMYDPGWPERMIGYPIDCQPDAKYGQWVARCLTAAFEGTEPTLNDVNAMVENPVAKTTRRIQYTRLTLPVRGHDGRTEMLSASWVDKGINFGATIA